MTIFRTSRRLLSTAAVAAVAVAGLAGASFAGAGAAGADTATQPPVTAHSDYLALGDSVSFGYRESSSVPTPDYSDAASFVGFPTRVASALRLHLANASCPGETTSSFIDTSKQSNGCESSPGGGPGYRTGYPLHVSYKGSQLAYAVRFLKTHQDTRLVTLMIGANDGLLCQETTSDNCASELPTVLGTVIHNVTRILGTLRHQAGYQGQIVLLTYYSTDYTDSNSNAASLAVNYALTKKAKRFNAHVADGFKAFKQASAQAGGDTCKAGLLTFLSGGGCGIHPSVAGQDVLATAVEKVVKH